ncbi:MAG: alcohol dehydrogenase [Deltaproteobacteria bacterium]|nr:alcohol dehydrogenase [Deltaproteobacteria bacterium]
MIGGVRARAAIAFEPGAALQVEAVTVRDPGPGEVRVRIAACGICASDLHVWRTGEGIGFPAVLGHEASGVVEAVGDDVREVSEGERVVLAWIPRCGVCGPCHAGRTHLCSSMRTDGSDGSLRLGETILGRYMSVSGLSERVVVSERAVIPVPDGLPLRDVCLIGCGVTTGFGAATLTGGVRAGESVAVFGCGCVGLSAIQGARIAGAFPIVAVDPNPARLDLACRLGATDRVAQGGAEAIAKIHELTGGGAALAIECVGKAVVVRHAFDAIAPGGRAIAVGLTRYAEEVSIPVVSLVLDKTLRGSIHGSADPAQEFPRLFGLAADGEFRLAEMSGPDYPLEQVNEAFEALASGTAVRPRVVFEEMET